MSNIKQLCFLIWIMLIVFACGSIIPTPIGNIKDNPRDYDGKIVTVEGTVKEVFSLFIVKYFVVEDDTGEIAVITAKTLPKLRQKIKVRGKVEEAFSLGDIQLIVILEDGINKKDILNSLR